MRPRKIIFWIHLTTGVIAGLVILIMSVTGILLAFERQITDLSDRDLRVAPGAQRLTADALIATVRTNDSKAQPSGLTIRSDAGAPAAINLGRERTTFVNPYTGAILGEGSQKTRAFFRSVTNVHRWLGTSEGNRALGRSITGACNFAFLFLVLSGFYLWLKRRPIVPRFRLTGKARYFNWHNVAGFWSAPFLFLIVLSGVLMSYQWATNLLYRLTSSELPPVRAAAAGGGPQREPSFIPPDIDHLWSIAAQRVPDWQTISLRFGNSPSAPLTFSIEQGRRGRPDLRSQLTLDPRTGEVVRWEPFSSFNLGRQFRSWARFVHTGEAGGFVGQTLAALVSAGACILVCTGLAMAWRRLRGRNPPEAA
jgi:uncharacterized iron-regulated membrane protein